MFELAQKIERAIHLLAPETGIYFAGVHAVPVPGGESTAFNITVGIDRVFEERTIEVVIRDVLTRWGWDRLTITLKIVRGIVGPAGHKALPDPHPTQA